MIIKIFNQSKPINLVITSFIIILGFVAAFLFFDFTWGTYKVISLMFAVFSLFAVDFICKKNKLSQQNSYPILFFSLLFCVYFISTDNTTIIFSNFFILLALRKIISLKSNINIIQKIFDASFWIAIATLFSFWSILFYIVLFISITLYSPEKYKHYLVPFVSIFVIFISVNSYNLYANKQLFQFQDALISFDFSNILIFKNNIILSVLLVLIMSIILFAYTGVRQRSKKNKSSYLLIVITLVISVVLFLLHPSMEILLFAYFPISVLLSVIIKRFSKN